MFYGTATPPPVTAQITRGGRTSLGEQLRASFDSMAMVNNSTSNFYQRMEAYELAVDKIKAETGLDVEPPEDIFDNARSPEGGGAATMLNYAVAQMAWYEREFKRLRQDRPDLAEFIPTSEGLLGIMSEKAKERERVEADLNSRAGLGAKAAGFVGAVGGSLTDPINQITLPLGGASKTVLGAAAKGAAINAGIETALQPFVQSNRENLGLEAGFDQAVDNIALAGVGGGVLGAGGKGLEIGASAIADRVPSGLLSPDRSRLFARELNDLVAQADLSAKAAPVTREAAVQAYERPDVPKTPLGDYVAAQVQADITLRDKSPVTGRVQDKIAHEQAVRGAMAGDDFSVPQGPVTREVVTGGLEVFDPRVLAVDAKRFQFKSGGDKDGVTDRLSDVTQWDPARSNQVIVWEDEAGQSFIVDGHQRSALARRLLEADPKADIRLYGTRYRAADGIAAQDARVIAAAKNLSEGSGSAVDAAKIMKVAPDILEDGSLPLSSVRLKQAQGLARLGDDAFLAVVNGVILDNMGAAIGARVPLDQQDMIVRLLADVSPDNLFQAETIIDQALSQPVRVETTASLFGEEDIATSLYKERAKVLDRALKQLRRDATVFRTLIDNEADISARGQNKLDQSANKKEVTDNAQAEALLRRLANSKGTISDALNAAAVRLGDGEPLARVARDFAASVKSDGLSALNPARSDTGGSAGGGSGRAEGSGRADIRPAESAGPASAVLASRPSDRLEEITQDIDRLEQDLFGETPEAAAPSVDLVLDENGEVGARALSAEDVQGRLDQDQSMLDRLRGCVDE